MSRMIKRMNQQESDDQEDEPTDESDDQDDEPMDESEEY
jgi:hypothetical protein